MSAGFIGRERELQLLGDAHRSEEAAFIPIYGRRRVGKSELIVRFMKAAGGLYFLGKQAPAGLQLAEFLREAALALHEPLLADVAVSGWKQALEMVLDRAPRDRKLVLALDEFQWSAYASPELPSVIQELWDRRIRQQRNVLLVLCGSYVGFMEREVLGRQSPLFGRRTAQIHLKPFGFREAALFHPHYSSTHRAEAYFICGGVPLYLRSFTPTNSVETNVVEQILDPYGPLNREPDFLLREELREVETYHAVLEALASGRSLHADVARHVGIDGRRLNYYLSQLIELGYVGKRYPLTESRPTARQVRYEVTDPLLRFWFRFVFPNLGYLQQMGPRKTYRNIILPELPAYFGTSFERLCREALPALYEREGVEAAFEIGEYWSKDVQIDVVGLREDGWTDLGECKWGPVKSLPRLQAELEAKVPKFPNARNATVGRRLFVRALGRSVAPAGSGPRLHTLDDLYSVDPVSPTA
ncbi:MAG: ATP-binding protein [Acidobacteria bacterium]|nr:ATP-binding protein [Acidobacteriota bacterium]